MWSVGGAVFRVSDQVLDAVREMTASVAAAAVVAAVVLAAAVAVAVLAFEIVPSSWGDGQSGPVLLAARNARRGVEGQAYDGGRTVLTAGWLMSEGRSHEGGRCQLRKR